MTTTTAAAQIASNHDRMSRMSAAELVKLAKAIYAEDAADMPELLNNVAYAIRCQIGGGGRYGSVDSDARLRRAANYVDGMIG